PACEQRRPAPQMQRGADASQGFRARCEAPAAAACAPSSDIDRLAGPQRPADRVLGPAGPVWRREGDDAVAVVDDRPVAVVVPPRRLCVAAHASEIRPMHLHREAHPRRGVDRPAVRSTGAARDDNGPGRQRNNRSLDRVPIVSPPAADKGYPHVTVPETQTTPTAGRPSPRIIPSASSSCHPLAAIPSTPSAGPAGFRCQTSGGSFLNSFGCDTPAQNLSANASSNGMMRSAATACARRLPKQSGRRLWPQATLVAVHPDNNLPN